MKRRMIRAMLCGLLCWSVPLLTSCWDRVEVNDIAIIVGAGIDQMDGKQVKLSAEIYIPVESTGEGQESGMKAGNGNGKTFVSSAAGSSMAEAMYKLQERLSRKLYWGHNDIFVIGQARAEHGIEDDLDFILRYVRMRERANIYISEGSAVDVLGIIPRLEPNSMEALSELSKTEISITVDLKEIIERIVETPDETYAIPYINRGKLLTDVSHVRNPNVPYFRGMSLFKKGKMNGNLNSDLTWGYFWITNQIKGNTIISLKMPEEQTLAVLLTHSKTTLIPSITPDGKWKMKIKVRGEGNLLQNTSSLDFMNPAQHKAMIKKTNEEVEMSIRQALKVLQKKYKTDVLDFGDRFRKLAPKQWQKEKKNWSTMFSEIETELDVEINIQRPGILNQNIKKMNRVNN
ncbi:Ger(x)C family spore germination protein [Paenibacillus paridis]|uniref:Ger(x)C family spore germination protein n=1 Tax=Paenibacillus paridis TaxID=2583376 RepID=UPI001124737F